MASSDPPGDDDLVGAAPENELIRLEKAMRPVIVHKPPADPELKTGDPS